jgi:hypothetical protein
MFFGSFFNAGWEYQAQFGDERGKYRETQPLFFDKGGLTYFIHVRASTLLFGVSCSGAAHPGAPFVSANLFIQMEQKKNDVIDQYMCV